MGDEKRNINIAKPLTFHKGLTYYGPRHRLQETHLKVVSSGTREEVLGFCYVKGSLAPTCLSPGLIAV